MNDIGQVLEEVLDVSAQWYHLGLQLKVRTGTLDNIQAQFPDSQRQLLEMLKTWLITSDNTSWRTLIAALRSQSVGASQLAGVLEEKYFVVEPTEVDISMFASDSWPVTPTFISAASLISPKIGPPSKVSPPPFFNKVVAKCDFFLLGLPIYPIVHVVMLTKEAVVAVLNMRCSNSGSKLTIQKVNFLILRQLTHRYILMLRP